MASPKKLSKFSVGERIHYLRGIRGFTQADLAKLTRLSQSTIAQIETGKKDPSLKTLEKITDALNIQMAVLFATEDVHVFDMKRLKSKYKKVDDLNETLYFALGKVVAYAKDIAFIK